MLTRATLGIHGDEKEVGLPEAMQEAEEALTLSLESKLQLVVDIPSEGEGEGEGNGELGRGGEDNQENVEPMELTPLGRKRPHPLESDDSDADIGRRKVTYLESTFPVLLVTSSPTVSQTQSGRPKRAATMSATERRRSKKRAKRALDSDDSGQNHCPPPLLTHPFLPSPLPPPFFHPSLSG